MAANPIHRLLDERGVPWRESQASLGERYGITGDPWTHGSPIVLLDTAPPFVPGLLRPMQFRVDPRYDPAMPPTSFSGYVWTEKGEGGWFRRSDNSVAALRIVTESLEGVLGPGERDDSSNTSGRVWQSGPASIRAICWPPRLQRSSFGNVVHDAEPRTRTACHVTVETGYRPPCTPRERGWIDSFVPHIALDRAGALDPAAIPNANASPYTLEYVREPCPGFERTLGRIGRTADGEALIFTSDQLHIVPTAQLEHVLVERMLPARGSGGAWIHLACRSAFGERLEKRLALAGGYGREPDGLNEQAERIADWLGIPCILGDYELDD